MRLFQHFYVVEGNTKFPIDMLRYDYSGPAGSDDARIIEMCLANDEHSEFRARVLGYRVILRTRNPNKKWTPTIGRWKSFGWKVVEQEEPELLYG